MATIDYFSKSVSDTDRLGAALAKHLPERTTVALIGSLGTGKTQLVRSLCSACCVSADTVVSPTFVLLQEYGGRRTIRHLDAYRIKDDDEFLELGVEELYELSGIVVIEWADRVRDCLPREFLEIRITDSGPTERLFQIDAHGTNYDASIEGLRSDLQQDR